MENSEKKCCVTGHREINSEKIPYIREKLREEIIKCIENGYSTFYSGFAKGVDLIFADVVVDLKKEYPHIKLEAAIPYRGRLNTKDKEFHRLLKECSKVHVLAEKYVKSTLLNRNRFMVQNSDTLIAVYDGREKGGTLFTIRYAHAIKKRVVLIDIEEKPLPI